MKATYAFQLVGIALMAFGGGIIGRELPMGSIPVLCFATGVLLLAYTPSIALRKRISDLEQRLDSAPNQAEVP